LKNGDICGLYGATTGGCPRFILQDKKDTSRLTRQAVSAVTRHFSRHTGESVKVLLCGFGSLAAFMFFPHGRKPLI